MKSVRGPIALRMGGIIWRLALETLDMEEGFVAPPATRAYVTLEVMKSAQTVAYDEALTDDEMGIIYGVYKTFTGSCNHVQPSKIM